MGCFNSLIGGDLGNSGVMQWVMQFLIKSSAVEHNYLKNIDGFRGDRILRGAESRITAVFVFEWEY